MSIIKCKMCGGTLEINNNETVAVCEYCGTKQTLPKLDNERKSNLYDRANHFRRNNEFDKAMGIYEQILNEDNVDAESYWSILLCRYGIEYVEDPTSHKRIPTVNRAQFTSVFDDEDYKSALQYADSYQREIYESEANAINEIQKGILAISQKEEPFDVFICYKETDHQGRRTQDSVLAQELYYELVEEGFKVFFAKITLEDKLGQEYEPYIFAALNSAKVMVVLGTKPEHFNAVWVKNEWSRYLSLIKNGADKMLIPAYRDMDPYDLPEEFSHLQAQDMSKLGFMQDLVRGIKKIATTNEPKTIIKQNPVVHSGGVTVEPLLERVFMFLEDGNWGSADEYCEKVLDIKPKNAMAYLGKMMAELQVRKQEDLRHCAESFENNNNYQKVLRFANDELVGKLKEDITYINERNEEKRKNDIYQYGLRRMEEAKTEKEFEEVYDVFDSIVTYKDAQELRNKAEVAQKMAIYNAAGELATMDSVIKIKRAIDEYNKIIEFLDAQEQIDKCYCRIEEIKTKQEQERIEKERLAEIERIRAEKRAKHNKIIREVVAIVIGVCAIFAVVLNKVVIPSARYTEAVELMDSGKYNQAVLILRTIENYKDSDQLVKGCMQECMNSMGDFEQKVSAGAYHTVGLKSDGTVVAVGNNNDGQCDVSEWTDIVAVSAGNYHTVGIKSDGKVVAVGNNNSGQCNVLEWTDVVAVSAGDYHTVGIKSDGTVVAVGNNNSGQCNVSEWADVVAVSAGGYHTVGIKSDGTAVAVGYNDDGQCNVLGWTDIVELSAGSHHTVGITSDGTVVAVGNNSSGQCNVLEWADIVAVFVGGNYTVGLKTDGAAVVTGENGYGQHGLSEWTDIIAISAGKYHAVGLNIEETVITIGHNAYGQCDVSEWKLFE